MEEKQLRAICVEAHQVVRESNDPWLTEVFGDEGITRFTDYVILAWVELKESGPFPATQEEAVAVIKDRIKEVLRHKHSDPIIGVVTRMAMQIMGSIATILVKHWWKDGCNETDT
jgi:hypothetical protein